jgi:hypothetical protein
MLTIGLLFWILYIIGFIFGWVINWPQIGTPTGWRPLGYNLLLWVLLFLLGWGTFGWPVRG